MSRIPSIAVFPNVFRDHDRTADKIQTRPQRFAAIAYFVAVYAIGLVLVLALFPPAPQEKSYHHFADQRVCLGIPHCGDVVSNLFIGLVLRLLLCPASTHEILYAPTLIF